MPASADSLHGYHVHIYYKDETLAAAQALRDRLAASFPVQIGKNAGIAGPHPVSQIQIIFKKEAFQQVVPWLMLNRDGLDILVHPLSDNEYDDHTGYALWMGTQIQLKVETLPHGPYPARLLPAGCGANARTCERGRRRPQRSQCSTCIVRNSDEQRAMTCELHFRRRCGAH